MSQIKTIDIEQELSQNFIDFSHEANEQRAFADARDGLKPGQRACLWEMYTKGYSSKKPHVKSAKISGGVIASWWPHGDAAIYNTFARMSQNWINNIPEVDWHGANGSVQISGEPAASRYTEARLAKATEEGMLAGIEKNNVPMKLNFSEDEEWPQVLPALMPRLMINGCQGIGSTIANVWLPHNLNELAAVIIEYINTGKIDYNKLAPDFPTGGIIINKKDLPIIYKTGKGKVILRGKATIDGNKILITEIPYQVYVEPLIDQIKKLIVDNEITGIDNILNKSDKKKLLIEIDCNNNPEFVLRQLYRKTSLQKTYSANQYALVGKTPKLLTLQQYLDVYIQHNYDCIKRENEFDLTKAKDKLEIVNGLIKALEDIDNIIALIKASDSSKDAVTNLIKKYAFTERQAKAIVNMKLGRLAHLEKVELNKEQKDLTSTINSCTEVIQNEGKQKEIYLKRFTNFVKKYGKPRKTQLTNIEIKNEDKEIEKVEPEKCVVVMSKNGFIKRIPSASFRKQKRNGKGVKTTGDITSDVIRTNTVDSLMVFTNQGRMYRILVDNIPTGTNTSIGQSIKTLVSMEPNEEPTLIYSLYRDTDANYVFFATKNGIVKKTALTEFTNTKRKTGIVAISLKEGDSLASVNLIKDEKIILVTHEGMEIKFNSSEVSATGRATAGMKGINLKDGDYVIAALPVRHDEDQLAIISESGLGMKINLSDLVLQKRAGRGLIVYKPTKNSGKVACAMLVSDEDSVVIMGANNSICISAKDIPCLNRGSSGNQLIKGTFVTSASKV